MRKKSIILLATLLYSLSYSSNLTIDSLINNLKIHGIKKTKKNFEIERIRVEKTKVDRMNRDGVEIDITQDYSYTKKTNNGDPTTTAKVKYDYFTAGADIEKDGTLSNWVGLEKNITDIFYSEKQFEQNILGFDSKKRLNNSDREIDNHILELIDLYTKYKDKELELKLKKELYPTIKKNYTILKRKLELGTSSRLDFEYVKTKKMNYEEEIKSLERTLETIKSSFGNKFGIYVGDYDNLLDYSNSLTLYKSSLSHIGLRTIENLKLDRENSKERLSYSKFNHKMPKISAGAKYDIDDSDWRVYVSFNKKLFNYDDQSKKEEINIREIDANINYEKGVIQNEINNTWNDYKEKKAILSNLKRTANTKSLEYKINEKMYQQGSKAFIDYMEKQDEYSDAKLAYEKSKNELHGFLHKIKYKR